MSSLIAGLLVQISLGFGEANCSYLYLGLLEDMLGDLTGLLYLTCFAVIIVSFHRWQK